MELGLFQKQTLKLVMTQELKQAIQLLQYSSTELVDYLQDLALENPLLEIKVESSDPYSKCSRTTQAESKDFDPIEQLNFGKKSLTNHLYDQLNYLKLDATEKTIVRHLILSIDENGYLNEEMSVLAQDLNIPVTHLEKALVILQQLEPVGIGASNLQECLLLQLQKLPNRSLLTEEIVSNYLNHLANKNWKIIEKDLHVTTDQIKASFELIRTLDPKPGSKFNSDEITQVVIPDLIMTNVNDMWLISVNDSIMPMIQIHREYGQILQNEKNNEATPYLREKYKEFQWLKKSIEHRKVTLIKVMEAIVERQPDFFNGECKLTPLTLREVADVTEVHESTVSRTVRNKYVQTSYGIFELKHFFSSGVKTSTGDTTSSDSVKQEIHAIVSKEDKKKPLSDQKIASYLETSNGIIISRRTVQKYREQLNIPSSSRRKSF